MAHENACALLWAHSAITLDGKMQPCCRFDIEYNNRFRKPLLSEGFMKGWTSKQYNELRERMLAGEKLEECKKCRIQEQVSGKSMRTDANDEYGYLIGQEPKLKFLELGFSTHCNLACRMCDELASSTIYRIKHPKEKVRIGFDLNVDDIDVPLDDLEEIKVVGGEPMMAKNHDTFLNKLLESKCNISNLVIRYHTNCTVKPSDNVIEFWKKTKKIYLVLSIDGVGRVNEIQRTGHKWEDLLEVLDFYKKLSTENPNIRLRMHTLITAINVMDVGNIYDFYTKNINKDPNTLSLDTVFNRQNLALCNMPDDKKKQAYEYISNLTNIPEDRKNMLLGIIERSPERIYTTDDIANDDFQKKVDVYTGQNIKDYL